MTHPINWTLPIETTDGTPLVLDYGPDLDGDYWAIDPAGTRRFYTADGRGENGCPPARNRVLSKQSQGEQL